MEELTVGVCVDGIALWRDVLVAALVLVLLFPCSEVVVAY
jgi:hypothetical protein